MIKQFVLIFLASFLFSCSGEYGHKVMGENLTVYFISEGDEELATSLAKYMKKRQLLSGEKQDVQLVKEGKKHYLKVIASETASVKEMPISERSLLLTLQKELQDSIFTNTQFSLVICNDKFETIYNINQ